MVQPPPTMTTRLHLLLVPDGANRFHLLHALLRAAARCVLLWPSRIECLLALAVADLCLAQVPDSLWSRTYGGESNDFWTDCRELPSSDLLLTGYTVLPPYRNSQAWLMKTDPMGNPRWNRTYGTSGNEHTWSVYPLPDGYVLTGFGEYDIWPTDAVQRRIFVVRTDLDGQPRWSERCSSDIEQTCHTAIPLPNGSIVVIGTAGSYSSESDGLVMCLDRDGNILWNRTYGDDQRSNLWGGVETPDGGFLFVGSWWYDDARRFDGWILRTDAEGTELWQRTYGGSETNDELKGVFIDVNGDIWAGGTYYQYRDNYAEFWLIHLNESGDSLWAGTYGAQRSETCYSIERTLDDGFLMTGSTYSFDDQAPGVPHGWVLRLDRQGDSLWSRTFEDIIWRGRQAADSGYLLVGATDAWGAGAADAWLIRMGSEANTRDLPSGSQGFRLGLIYPNPFNSTTTIELELPVYVHRVSLALYDVLGRKAFETQIGNATGHVKYTLDARDLASGVYFVNAHVGEVSVVRKVALIR
jgi:hypothetical protein